MAFGRVSRILKDKGFGFIKSDNNQEFFFHRSAVKGAVFESLEAGTSVSFNEEEGEKGPRAEDVRLV